MVQVRPHIGVINHNGEMQRTRVRDPFEITFSKPFQSSISILPSSSGLTAASSTKTPTTVQTNTN